MRCSWARDVLSLLVVLLLGRFALAAPVLAPAPARGLAIASRQESLRTITIDNTSPLLQYNPPLCGKPLDVEDPLEIDPGACAGTWLTVRNPAFASGSVTTATGISAKFDHAAPSVSFRFAGSAIAWRTTSYPAGRGGLASVQLDDALPVLVNTSSLLPGDSVVFNVLGFEKRDLDANVAHTIIVKLIPQPETSTNATFDMLDIDSFVYTEVPTSPPTFTTVSSTQTPAASATVSAMPRANNKAFNGALIALCVCGGLVVIVLTTISVITIVRRRRRRRTPSAAAVTGSSAPPASSGERGQMAESAGQTVTIRPGATHARGHSLVSPLMTEHILSQDTVRSSGYVYG